MDALTVTNNEAVNAELTRQLYDAYPVVVVGTLLNALILIVVQWPVVNHSLATLWLVLMLCFTAGRYLLTLTYKHTAPSIEQDPIWSRYFTIGLLSTSVLWGSTAVILYPPDNIGHQVFLAFVLAGICAGGIVTLSYRKKLVIPFLTFCLTPIIIRLFLTDQTITQAMGLMGILFFVTLYIAGQGFYKTNENQIHLRLQAKRREKLSAEARQREALNFLHNPLAVIEWDMDFKVTAWNPSAEKIFGYKSDETIGRHATDLIIPADQINIAQKLWGKLLHQEHRSPITFNNLTSDGRTITCEWYNAPIIDNDGNHIAVISLAQDISERVEITRAMKQSEQRYRCLIEGAADMILIHDKEGNILDANQSACDNLGYSYAELIDMKIPDIEIGISADAQMQSWLSMPANTPTTISGNHKRKNSTIFPVEIRLTHISEPGNNLFLAIARDVSEHHQQKQQLIDAILTTEEANKAKSTFLSSMSHELRTPMNAILGFSQLLEADKDSGLSGTQYQFISEILTAGNHLLTLINEILDLSRIEAGKLTLTIEDVHLKEVIDECVRLITPQLENYNITLTLEPNCQDVILKADHTRVKQVLINLLSNATKYNTPGGKIFIKCHNNGTRLRINITDTGKGIDNDKLNQLFTAFNRLGAESSEIEGTGIGLVISKKVIEMMAGEIGVESQPGKGSTFWIEIPLADTHQTAASQDRTEIPVTDTTIRDIKDTTGSVLYIEDNRTNMMLVQNIIAQFSSLELLEASEAQTGIALAAKYQPNLILMDISLPGIDGFEALAILRNQESTRNIPVIAVSASAMKADIIRAQATGFKNYITKPINISDFINTIELTLHARP